MREKLAMCEASRSSGTTAEPMYPVAPVTKTLMVISSIHETQGWDARSCGHTMRAPGRFASRASITTFDKCFLHEYASRPCPGRGNIVFDTEKGYTERDTNHWCSLTRRRTPVAKSTTVL